MILKDICDRSVLTAVSRAPHVLAVGPAGCPFRPSTLAAYYAS